MEDRNIDQFILNRILKKKNGLLVDYSIQQNVGTEFMVEKHGVTLERPLHEDFLREINSLRVYIMKIMRFTNIISVISDNSFGCTSEQSAILTSLYNNTANGVQINGARFFTTGTVTTGIQIEYSFCGFSTQNMNLKSYKVGLTDKDVIHEFEDEMKTICANLRQMAFDYLFNGVGGDIMLPFTDE